MSDPSDITGAELLSYVERIETLEAGIRDMNADKSEVYKELKGRGFDASVLRKIVARRKLDPAERQELDAILELYLDAIARAEASRVHVHVTPARTREADETPRDAVGSREPDIAGADAAASPGANSPERAPEPEAAAQDAREVGDEVVGDAHGTGEGAPPDDPVPAQPRRLPHDHPKTPLATGGLIYRNFVEAYEWPEAEVQARWQAFSGGASPVSAAVQQASS